MSIRENIELYGLPAIEPYERVLTDEFGAVEHPSQPDARILQGLPFYGPRVAEDHVSILSFNDIPLPYSMVEALIAHPELFPDEVLVRWTQEQDLIFEATLGELRGQSPVP